MAIVTRKPQPLHGYRVPGIFNAWHRTNAAWRAAPDEPDLWDLDDDEYREAWHAAADVAEPDTAERIAKGETIVGVLLPAGHRFLLPYPADLLWPRERDSFTVPRVSFFQADPDRLYDISATDVVTVNEAATAEWKAKRATEAARRATAANRDGHNGHAVTLTEEIS